MYSEEAYSSSSNWESSGKKGANAKGVGNMGWEARPRMTEDHEGTAFMVIAWVGKPT